MKKLLALALGAALLPLAARAAADPYAGWTEAQFKAKIKMLTDENAVLKAKASTPSTAPAASAPSTPAAAPSPITLPASVLVVQEPVAKASKPYLLDDFEGAMAKNGQPWYSGCDTGNLGSTVSPDPFVPAKGGSKDSPGHSGRIKGHLGTEKAPWPWATLSLKMNGQDLTPYSAISVWVKGNGGSYRLLLGRTAVKDFAHFVTVFNAPKDWTKMTFPLSAFKQPDTWGEKIPMAWNDVEKIDFMPLDNDKDYDISIDDLTLLP
jgi:hypothetical protein